MSPRQRITTALAVLLLAAPLAAQGVLPNAPAQDAALAAVPAVAPTAAPTAPPVVVHAQPSLAPTLSNTAVGVRANVAAAPAVPAVPAPFQGSVGRNPAMMIVGGVGLIVGAIVGGDAGTIIMIGGGALGIYGLWQYLK